MTDIQPSINQIEIYEQVNAFELDIQCFCAHHYFKLTLLLR